jgi:hypothetical protein
MNDYQEFQLGGFHFSRDDYFAHIFFPTASGKPMDHKIDIDAFLRPLQRDIAWSFFYGMVKFDDVFGTINHYGTVEVFGGKYHKALKQNGLWHAEELQRGEVEKLFTQILEDWVPADFDPLAKQEDRQDPDYPINVAFKGMEFKSG